MTPVGLAPGFVVGLSFGFGFGFVVGFGFIGWTLGSGIGFEGGVVGCGSVGYLRLVGRALSYRFDRSGRSGGGHA